MQLNGVCCSAHFEVQSYLSYHVAALEVTSTKARKVGACLRGADRLERERNIRTQSPNCSGTTWAAAPPKGSEGPPREGRVEQWRALQCYSPLSSSLCCPLSTPSPFSMPSFIPFLLPEMPLPLCPPFAFPNSTSFSLDQLRRPFSFLFKSMKCFINLCAILAQGPCYFSLYPSNLSTCAAQASTKGRFSLQIFPFPKPPSEGASLTVANPCLTLLLPFLQSVSLLSPTSLQG